MKCIDLATKHLIIYTQPVRNTANGVEIHLGGVTSPDIARTKNTACHKQEAPTCGIKNIGHDWRDDRVPSWCNNTRTSVFHSQEKVVY